MPIEVFHFLYAGRIGSVFSVPWCHGFSQGFGRGRGNNGSSPRAKVLGIRSRAAVVRWKLCCSVGFEAIVSKH
jgi:hypothetical protein